MASGVVKEFSVEEEYKKDTGITPQDVMVLREWLRTQPHLPTDHITDLDLILTYHSCERSTELTKQVLDANYTMRTHFSFIFKDRVVDDKIENNLNVTLVTVLPTCSKEDFKCLYIHFNDLNPKNLVVANNIRTLMMVIDLYQYEEGTWPGLMLVVNLEGITLGHLTTVDLPSIQQFFHYLQEIPLEEEYKKHSDITPQDIARLRDWLNTQPHLPSQYITDLDLILAYHCCERSTEVTKQVLDLHYTLKTLFTSLFSDRVVDKSIEKSLNTYISMPLPTRTKEGNKCLFARFIDFNYKNFVAVDAIRTVLMTLDLWQCEEGTWPGFVMIVDLEGLTLGHLTTVDFKILQHFFFFFQEAMFIKLKGIHFINPPPFIDKVLAALRSIIKKSLMEGLHVHPTGSRTIDQFFPMDQLPQDCGGTYQTLAECKDEILMKLKANAEFFQKDSKKRVTESLRPGKPKTFTDFFGGIEGSFKKLDID